MDKKIEKLINIVKEEISLVNEVDGLCYFASNNLLFDLQNAYIDAFMFNIRDLALTDFDHYFLIIKDSKDYLVDLTFKQFVKEEGKRNRISKIVKWPSEILEETELGQKVLNSLINDGYMELNDEVLNIYLKCFNSSLDFLVSLDDIFFEPKQL